MRGVRMRVLVALATLAVLAVACGSDSNDAEAGGASATGATAATGATDSGSGDDHGAGSLYGGSNGTTGATAATGATANADVSVSLNNYLFDPATVRVSSGDVVAVRNANAKTPHTFTVVGENVDLELAPLTTETTTIDLAPGTYQLICRFHESLGMKATLKVT
ncbi:MAG TPA: cupredoxin domain-containing protein [Actinomycetota bacterium]|nr:cupredoxin domain-containing protein [Actinomycetota bacterium]